MKSERNIIACLRQLLDANLDLRDLAKQSLEQAAQANPHLRTNPVRSLDDWFAYLECFLHRMPWQTMDIGEDASFFRRIDQNIGYFYFLLDQPLDAFKNRGYIYPSLQYEPRMAQWLKEYNTAWGKWLSGSDSWNEAYYQLARSDSRFELDTDRYESPDNWHSWNDFFARRLKNHSALSNQQSAFRSPCDGVIMVHPVKTASIANWLDLLGDSPYREMFADGETTHIVLDVFDYHRFHAPCAGRVVECKIIPGIHAGGGVIIWDKAEGRYRYDQLGVTDFQMLETRGVIVLDTPDFGYIALVAVGVQQVSSVRWTEKLSVISDQLSDSLHPTPYTLHQGDELGRFLFGGSDIALFFEKGKAPSFEYGKIVKVGEKL